MERQDGRVRAALARIHKAAREAERAIGSGDELRLERAGRALVQANDQLRREMERAETLALRKVRLSA